MNDKVDGLAVRQLLDAVGARTTAPGGGLVVGVVTALAGALAGMCARFAGGGQPGIPGGTDLATRADELRARALSLAQSDPEVYAAYVRARRAGTAAEMAEALDETIRIPLEMAEVAAGLAEVALGLARFGNPYLRGDATAAVLLSAAAARAGAVLVCENLAGTESDPRRARAAAIVASVTAAERDVLSLYPALTAPGANDVPRGERDSRGGRD